MCGAFSIIHPFKEIGRPFNAGYNGPDPGPLNNARPGQRLPVILNAQPREVVLAEWGLKPQWKNSHLIFNARKESLDTKVFFFDSFRNRRCLVLADGFYEWAAQNGRKIPYKFTLKTKSLFAFAGIWQQDSRNKEPEFAIITTLPNALVAKVHDRMPAILPLKKESLWLESKLLPPLALDLLQPYPAHLMEAVPVAALPRG